MHALTENELRKVAEITRGMIEVSQKYFYATVGQMNVHPRAEREASYWETPMRSLKGVTTPGYLCELVPDVYCNGRGHYWICEEVTA